MVVRGLLGPPRFAGQGQSLIRGGPGSTHGVETAILGCTGFGIWGSLSALTPPRTRGTAGAGGVGSWEGSLSPTWGCSRSFAAGRGMNAADMSGLVLACPPLPPLHRTAGGSDDSLLPHGPASASRPSPPLPLSLPQPPLGLSSPPSQADPPAPEMGGQWRGSGDPVSPKVGMARGRRLLGCEVLHGPTLQTVVGPPR